MGLVKFACIAYQQEHFRSLTILFMCRCVLPANKEFTRTDYCELMAAEKFKSEMEGPTAKPPTTQAR